MLNAERFGVLLPPSWGPQVKGPLLTQILRSVNQVSLTVYLARNSITLWTLFCQEVPLKPQVGLLTQHHIPRRPTLCAATHTFYYPLFIPIVPHSGTVALTQDQNLPMSNGARAKRCRLYVSCCVRSNNNNTVLKYSSLRDFIYFHRLINYLKEILKKNLQGPNAPQGSASDHEKACPDLTRVFWPYYNSGLSGSSSHFQFCVSNHRRLLANNSAEINSAKSRCSK